MGTKVSKLGPQAEVGTKDTDQLAFSEAWRYTGPFTRWNRFKSAFPGLGIATVAFAAYCGYEYLFLNDDHGHGESGHDEGHH
jgi:NADH dehydrogenase (ubiquinone) 1 beta subcomplex subunit 3